MRWLTHPVSVRICQIAIGVVFVAASLSKLGDLRSFAEQVHNFRLVPVAAENLVAMVLPWIELVAALALVLGVRARAGALVVTTMLVVFTAGILLAMARGLDFECGCFGTADASRVGAWKVLQNLAMLVIAWNGTRRPR